MKRYISEMTTTELVEILCKFIAFKSVYIHIHPTIDRIGYLYTIKTKHQSKEMNRRERKRHLSFNDEWGNNIRILQHFMFYDIARKVAHKY